MSRLTEFIKLLPQAAKNPLQVIEGIANAVRLEFDGLPEDEQEEIIRRKLICQECPYMSSNAVSNPALNYKTDRIDQHCICCGCPIKTKTASLTTNCGLEAYNKKYPDREPIPLKWTAYIKPKPTTSEPDTKTN